MAGTMNQSSASTASLRRAAGSCREPNPLYLNSERFGRASMAAAIARDSGYNACPFAAISFRAASSFMTPDIELTDAEHSIFEQILFDWEGVSDPYEVVVRNGERVATLMESLLPRGGIPVHRLSYFNDPSYRTGRLKGSRSDLFLRNSKTAEEMVHHPGFLRHLRYFVCGPDLRSSALKNFKEAVRDCGHVSGSDALELGELARKQVRIYGLASHDAAPEYFKAAIDGGMWVTHALTIERRVEAMRFVPGRRR
jgi:hypothetical protein